MSKNALVIIVFSIAACIYFSGCASGPPGLVITGTVTDTESGQPIAGAKVFDDGYANDPDWENVEPDKRSEWGAITNSKGEYSFLTWPEHHGIKVTAPGYKDQRRSLYSSHFTINKKGEEVFNFALERK